MKKALNSFRTEETGRSRAVTIPYGIRELVDDESLEPQVVKVRSQNRDTVVVTANFPVRTVNEVIPGYLINRVKRIALNKVTADICIPVINKSFNVLGVVTNSVSQVVDFSGLYVNEAFPSTVTGLAQAIVDQIKLITGLEITFTVKEGGIVHWVSFTPWAFFNGEGGANMLTNPEVLGFPLLSNAQAIDSVKLSWTTRVTGLSTSYIDVSSRALTMDSKILRTGNTVPNFLHRIHLEKMYPHVIRYQIPEPLAWINIDERHIDTIDLQISPDLKVNDGYFLLAGTGESNRPEIQICPHNVKLTLEFLVES